METNEKNRWGYPSSFWSANLTELFERAAYYSIASFIVIYLGRLGLGDYWPSTLNGFLWGLVYFLPVLSGAVADQVGFRRSLLLACLLLMAGYFLMGAPVWFGLATLQDAMGSQVTAGPQVIVPLLIGILLIGAGGSVVKPCISGTVQKTAGLKVVKAFAIFYMVINVGSLFGRGVGFVVRKGLDLSFIFAVATICAALAFLVVLLVFKDAPAPEGSPQRPRRSPWQVLKDMVLVLRNPRFALFLLVLSGFFFLYGQIYNVLPLYLKKVVEKDPAMDLYTMANPLVIVAFQLLITRLFGGLRPIRSMVVGTLIIAVSMALNIVPLVLGMNPSAVLGGLLPIASFAAIGAVAMVALGELFTSARSYEYIGALAPKGQEGLFLGYASLPMAVGALAGGPAGAAIFNEVMCKGATLGPDGLLLLDPVANASGWLILSGVGILSAAALWAYDRFLVDSRQA